MPALTPQIRACCLALLLPGIALAEDVETPATEGEQIEGYFLSRLVAIESLATGVHELSKQEQANLENLIAYEVNSARAGGVNGFAGGFSERRSDEEREATGISRMSDDQRVRLDQHIAGFLADQPVSYVYIGNGRGSRTARRGDGESFRGKGPLLRVNGSVSVTVGTSSAGSFYGGRATTVISDPKGRFNAVISYGTMKGNLPYSDYPYRRGPFHR